MSVEKQPKLTGKDQWKVLKRLLGYTAPHKVSITIALVLLIMTITGSIVGPLIIQRFIDDYLAPLNFPEREVTTITSTIYRYSNFHGSRVLFPIDAFSRHCA